MKRVYSLKTKKNFQEVFKRGKRLNERSLQIMVLKYIENDNEVHARKGTSLNSYSKLKIGIPISRNYGKAVERNKTRRRIKAICSEFLSELEESNYIIIRPFKGFKNLTYLHEKEIIKKLFKKANILSKDS